MVTPALMVGEAADKLTQMEAVVAKVVGHCVLYGHALTLKTKQNKISFIKSRSLSSHLISILSEKLGSHIHMTASQEFALRTNTGMII